MRILKQSLFAVATVILLTSCGSSVAPILSTPIENIDNQPLKVAAIEDDQLKTWSAANLVTDTIPGMSVDKAYAEIIPNLKGEKIIVAVVDSGIDIEHEDLKDIIWVNKNEIPNNGKDDDKNGYIDDIHGWNFLGDIVGENMEYVRYVKTLGPKFEGKSKSSISEADQADFVIYNKAMAEFEKDHGEALANKDRYGQMLSGIKVAHKAISEKLGKEDYTAEDLAAIKSPSEKEQEQIGMLTQTFAYGSSIPAVIDRLSGAVDYYSGRLDTHFNLNKDFRAVLGDNPDDFNDNKYGNNDVDGPDPKKADARHGTHVAGIIAAQRNNGIGMNGVAQNVEIMVVRAVPDGDEYDKDIALAIRYAVDNGAKVINTSFGKGYSPHPEWVWDAIKYAGEHDVLIVNAAGNDGVDLDIVQSYPSDQVGTGEEISDSFITIGALNANFGGEMVAGFSNYGTTSVDAFAPGVRIWATTPLDTYEYLSGTSMASPNVAGVAALIRSYFPKLSASQVKQVLMDSGLSSNSPVVLGGEESNIKPFNTISTSGKMVNLYNALIMASNL